MLEFMADAMSIPILLDGDTGYGNFNNVRRLVRKLEQRGIAALCIEDKLFPKTNSFLDGETQPLAEIEEFCGKIKAAKDVASDEDFAVVKFTPSGQVDTSFGTGGGRTHDFGFGMDRAFAVAADGAGGFVVLCLAVLAILAPVISPRDPNRPDIKKILAPPSATHALGTDQLGRDVFSRMLYGARVSLAVGFVSVVGHLVTPELRALVEAYTSGDVQKATEIHQKLLPVYTGMFRTQGVMTTKAALALKGLPAGPLRAPMAECTPEEIEQLKIDLAAGGVQLQ